MTVGYSVAAASVLTWIIAVHLKLFQDHDRLQRISTDSKRGDRV